MKSGYLYVLVHPSDPDLYKVGVTVLNPEKRLAQHNCLHKKYAGRIVKETGQKWELKTFITVPDPYWAEKAFWHATPFGVTPFRGGIEVERMKREWVEAGLTAAQKAGVRPHSGPLPDHVYANTAWMNKRLEGRGITLIGHVRSKFGRSTFKCGNGHEWRTVPNKVAGGEGCPQCGAGRRDSEDIRRAINASTWWLLKHPDRPGLIRIEQTFGLLERCHENRVWDDWQVHRYRNVEESQLARSLLWELLGRSPPKDHEPICMDLKVAEQAFRALIPRMQGQIALAEKRRAEMRQHDRSDSQM